MEKSVTEAINYRRSVRKFDPNKEIDSKIVRKCIENAMQILHKLPISTFGRRLGCEQSTKSKKVIEKSLQILDKLPISSCVLRL